MVSGQFFIKTDYVFFAFIEIRRVQEIFKLFELAFCKCFQDRYGFDLFQRNEISFRKIGINFAKLNKLNRDSSQSCKKFLCNL